MKTKYTFEAAKKRRGGYILSDQGHTISHRDRLLFDEYVPGVRDRKPEIPLPLIQRPFCSSLRTTTRRTQDIKLVVVRLDIKRSPVVLRRGELKMYRSHIPHPASGIYLPSSSSSTSGGRQRNADRRRFVKPPNPDCKTRRYR